MRWTRIGWIAVAAVVVCGGLLVSAYRHRQAREYKLPDGSVLRLEKVYYGKPESYDYDGWVGRLKKKLPQKIINYFSKTAQTKPGPFPTGRTTWWTTSTTHTNEDALYVYITRRDPATGKMTNVRFTTARLLDEHGCVFSQTAAGGEDDGRLASKTPGGDGLLGSVAWFRFEALPRRERTFRLQVFDRDTGKSAEFTIANPFSLNAPRKGLRPEPLPITQTQDGVSFILSDVKLQTNSVYGNPYVDKVAPPLKFVPAFQCLEDGQPSEEWQELGMELYDDTGNFSSPGWWNQAPILCSHEPAWKLRVRFFGSEKARYASNSVWTLRGLEVPAEGKYYTNLNSSQAVDGVRIQALFLAGIGDFKYSEDGEIVLEASPLKKPLEESSLEWGGTPPDHIVHGKTPHLMMKLWPLKENQAFTVRATDEKGREFYGYEMSFWMGPFRVKSIPGEVHYFRKTYGERGDPCCVLFDLPPDSKKIDLTFCVHTCRIAEFVFKPPTEILPASTNAAR